MGSRLKRLLFGNSSSSRNQNLKGRSYDSAVALDPPVKGSYPVAGNGPNVLDQIQQARSKKDAAKRQSRQSTAATAAAASAVPRRPGDPIERPRTAPHSGRPGGGYTAGTDIERTQSGFSMRSSPTLVSSSGRNSIRLTVEPPLPPPTPISRSSTPRTREIETYQPRKPTQPAQADVPDSSSPPLALHHRNASQISHKSHVDLLEAHSNIRLSQVVSKHRAKASGARDYGEDVADRNIADFGGQENRLDMDPPESIYLKSTSASKRGGVAVPREGGAHLRAASALGHGLGHEQAASDDMQHSRHHRKANSTRSAHYNSPRPGVVYPPRTDSTSPAWKSANSGRDGRPSVASNGIRDHRARALSPLSATTTTSSIHEEPEETSRRPAALTGSPDAVRARERARASTRDSRNPPPASLPTSVPKLAGPTQSQPTPTVTGAPSLKPRKRTMSEASQSTVKSTGAKSRSGSLSYSAFPSPSRRDAQVNEAAGRGQPSAAVSNHTGLIVAGAYEPPSLEGVVDLTNTVDTEVTTKTLPAVTHETVSPIRHEICEELITKEIHTHDVFHSVLPIIETELLPPKHYIPSPDGKGLIEIPEHMIPGRTASGSPNRNWEIVETGMGRGDHGSAIHQKSATQQSNTRVQSFTPANDLYYPANIEDDDDAADAPVIDFAYGEPRFDRSRNNIERDGGADSPVVGFTRGEPKANRSRANSGISVHTKGSSRTLPLSPKTSKSKNILQPILSGKKEYMTKEGYPRTEYLWRHPPVFETGSGRTQPVYLGAGLGDISSPTSAPASVETDYSDEDDTDGPELSSMRKPAEGEEELLFRDSGYGSQGMLPGLAEKTPLAGLGDEPAFDPADFEVIRYGRVVGEDDEVTIGKATVVSNAGGEATKALRRMKERRGSGAASESSGIRVDGYGDYVSEVETGMNGLNVRD